MTGHCKAGGRGEGEGLMKTRKQSLETQLT